VTAPAPLALRRRPARRPLRAQGARSIAGGGGSGRQQRGRGAATRRARGGQAWAPQGARRPRRPRARRWPCWLRGLCARARLPVSPRGARGVAPRAAKALLSRASPGAARTAERTPAHQARWRDAASLGKIGWLGRRRREHAGPARPVERAGQRAAAHQRPPAACAMPHGRKIRGNLCAAIGRCPGELGSRAPTRRRVMVRLHALACRRARRSSNSCSGASRDASRIIPSCEDRLIPGTR
jgi:hypothetical protein